MTTVAYNGLAISVDPPAVTYQTFSQNSVPGVYNGIQTLLNEEAPVTGGFTANLVIAGLRPNTAHNVSVGDINLTPYVLNRGTGTWGAVPVTDQRGTLNISVAVTNAVSNTWSANSSKTINIASSDGLSSASVALLSSPLARVTQP